VVAGWWDREPWRRRRRGGGGVHAHGGGHEHDPAVVVDCWWVQCKDLAVWFIWPSGCRRGGGKVKAATATASAPSTSAAQARRWSHADSERIASFMAGSTGRPAACKRSEDIRL
jgi:hypothetical protein